MTGRTQRTGVLADLMTARIREAGDACKAQRQARRLSLRAAAAEIGCPFNTLLRFERGEASDLLNFLRIVNWLDVPPAWFANPTVRAPIDDYRRGWDDCAAAVNAAIGHRPDDLGAQIGQSTVTGAAG